MPILRSHIPTVCRKQRGFYLPPLHTSPYNLPRKSQVRGNGLLAGDAAGVADGLSGEGICYSIVSGEIAALAVAKALEGNQSALENYEADLDRSIRQDHRYSNLMGRIVRRFPDAAYHILTSAGEGKSVLIPLLLGQLSFGESLRRLPGLLSLARAESRPEATGLEAADRDQLLAAEARSQ